MISTIVALKLLIAKVNNMSREEQRVIYLALPEVRRYAHYTTPANQTGHQLPNTFIIIRQHNDELYSEDSISETEYTLRRNLELTLATELNVK